VGLREVVVRAVVVREVAVSAEVPRALARVGAAARLVLADGRLEVAASAKVQIGAAGRALLPGSFGPDMEGVITAIIGDMDTRDTIHTVMEAATTMIRVSATWSVGK
jgi:hypothetical protein